MAVCAVVDLNGEGVDGWAAGRLDPDWQAGGGGRVGGLVGW